MDHLQLSITKLHELLVKGTITPLDLVKEAIRKMKAALSELVLVGVPNNIDEHMRFMDNSRFIDGNYDTKIYQEVMKNYDA